MHCNMSARSEPLTLSLGVFAVVNSLLPPRLKDMLIAYQWAMEIKDF